MTARQYNFTKQNGVVMKARRRFTKQNGVVKQILNGWTKTNGVVEKVYESSIAPMFARIIPAVSQRPYYIDKDYLVCEKPNTGGSVMVQEEYLTGGPSTQLSFGVGHTSFNYAGGTSANQSLIDGGAYRNHELPISDVYNPTNYSKYGGGIYVGPIKIGPTAYMGIKRTSDSSETSGYRFDMFVFSDTSSSVGTSIYGAYRFSSCLTLEQGCGVFVGKVTSAYLPTLLSVDVSFMVYDYDHSQNSSFGPSMITAFTEQVSSSGVVNNYGNYLGSIYTPNGQDCIFCINWDKPGSEYAKLCKYNIQTKTVTSVQLGFDRVVIGCYNGYTYVVTPSTNQDELFVVEKYDLSLSRVGTHAVALPSGQSQVTNLYAHSFTTQHSGGRYAAMWFYDGTNDLMLVLDLGLF